MFVVRFSVQQNEYNKHRGNRIDKIDCRKESVNYMRSVMDFDSLFDENGKQATIFTSRDAGGNYERALPSRIECPPELPDLRAVYESAPLHYCTEKVLVGDCFNFPSEGASEAKHRFFSTMSLFAIALLCVIALSILL